MRDPDGPAAEPLYRNLLQFLSYRAVSDTGVLAGAKYAGAGLGLLIAVIAARSLGPYEFGLVAVAISYCELVASLTSVKSLPIAIHYVSALRASKEHEQAAAVFKLSFLSDAGAGVLASLIVLVSIPWMGLLLPPDPRAQAFTVAFAVALPLLGLLGTSTAGLVAVRAFRLLAVFTIGERVVTLLLVVLLLAAGWGVWGYLLARVAGRAGCNLIMLWQATRLMNQAGRLPWWRVPLGRIASLRGELQGFFGWNYVSVTCTGLTEQLPVLLLGRFAGSAEAGFYNLARSLVNVAAYGDATLGQVTYPRLSAWSRSGTARDAVAWCWRWSWRAGLFVATAVTIVALALPAALPFALGGQYRPMVLGAQILLIAAAVNAVVFWVQPFYYAWGHVGRWAKLQVLNTLALLILLLIVTPAFGWLGLCWLLAVNRVVFKLFMALMASRAARSH